MTDVPPVLSSATIWSHLVNYALKQATQERNETEDRLRLLNAAVVQSKDSILITDAELDLPGPTITFVNHAFTKMTGYAAQEVIGKTPRILQGPNTDMTVVRRLRQELESGGTFFGQAIMYRKDGTQYEQEWQVWPIRNASGHISHYGSIQRDVTKVLRLKEALHLNEQLQHQLTRKLKIEHLRLLRTQKDAHIGSWETNLATMEVTWSDETYQIYETFPEIFRPTHQKFLEFVHPDDRAKVESAFQSSLHHRGQCSIEHRLLLPSGRLKFVEERWQVYFDESQKPLRAIGTCQDIAERTTMQAALVEQELLFRQVAENISAVFFLRTADFSKFFYVSPAFELIWGRSRNTLYKHPAIWNDVIVEGSPKAIIRNETLDTRAGNLDFEYQIKRPDGSKRWIQARGFPIFGSTGQLERVAGLVDDITDRKEHERKIDRLNRIRAVLGGISSAMLRLRDRDDLLLNSCRVAVTEGVFAVAWVGVIDRESQALKISAAQSEHPDTLNFLECYFSGIPEHERPAERTLRSLRPTIINDFSTEPGFIGNYEPLRSRGLQSCAALPLFVVGRLTAVLVLFAHELNFFDDDETALLEWMTRDLSFALENIETAQALRHLAYFDPLTGVANASLFQDRLNQFTLVARVRNSKVCVEVIDLKDFTRVNETLGRDGGDELLCNVAKRLQDDLVEPYALGRIGADTFAISAPFNETDVTTTRLRERTLEILKTPLKIRGEQVVVEVQAGTAIYPDDGDDSDSVFKNAETALKLAKASGAHHVYYSRSSNDRIKQRLALEKALRIAINLEQFVLHYQPRVDMRSGEIVGAEALIRWQHPERGLVAPAEFIPLAEESELIVPIGAWIVDTICSQQAAWVAADVPVVPIAANVSVIQFEKGDVVRTVRDALANHSLNPTLLHVEITESAAIHNSKVTVQIAQELSKLGVSMALDDFGTGYSSLVYLKRFPFTQIKIDRSFVTNITQSAEDAAIASAIIAIGHRMGMKVVAEGVENEGQLNYLRSQQCDEMQGFYFSPPVPVDVFESYLRSGKRMNLQTHDQ
jgi:diguanylate cyclase (GGDEF)-like protein/PAS domain S-box-containing protein